MTNVCMCCDYVAINKKHNVYIYIYIYISIYNISITYNIYNIYNIYIYICIKLDNTRYLYTNIYSYTVNVNLMLICIELLEIWSVIVNMPENWKFSVFEVIYYIFLQYSFLSIHSSLTYKRYMRDTPSLKILLSAIKL